MCIVYGMTVATVVDDRPVEDLTTRARIRDAAMAAFADKGFRGATMRGIAAGAGVSLGLVQHHFGSKERLRAACDERVLELVRLKMAAFEDGSLSDPHVLATLVAMAPAVQRYMGRALVDGSARIDEMVDEIMAKGEEFLTTTWPDRFVAGTRQTRDAAAVMIAINTSTMVLQDHLARRLDVEPWSETAIRRIGLATFDVYEAIGVMTDSAMWRQLRAAVEFDPRSGEE